MHPHTADRRLPRFALRFRQVGTPSEAAQPRQHPRRQTHHRERQCAHCDLDRARVAQFRRPPGPGAAEKLALRRVDFVHQRANGLRRRPGAVTELSDLQRPRGNAPALDNQLGKRERLRELPRDAVEPGQLFRVGAHVVAQGIELLRRAHARIVERHQQRRVAGQHEAPRRRLDVDGGGEEPLRKRPRFLGAQHRLAGAVESIEPRQRHPHRRGGVERRGDQQQHCEHEHATSHRKFQGFSRGVHAAGRARVGAESTARISTQCAFLEMSIRAGGTVPCLRHGTEQIGCHAVLANFPVGIDIKAGAAPRRRCTFFIRAWKISAAFSYGRLRKRVGHVRRPEHARTDRPFLDHGERCGNGEPHRVGAAPPVDKDTSC